MKILCVWQFPERERRKCVGNIDWERNLTRMGGHGLGKREKIELEREKREREAKGVSWYANNVVHLVLTRKHILFL